MKNTIYAKIRKRTSLVSVISVLCVGLAAFTGIMYMRYSVIKTSEKLGNSAANDSKQALITQTEEELMRLTESKAAVSDEKLSAIARGVEMISQNATKIMSEPENYGKMPVFFPDPVNAGMVTAQLRLPENAKLCSIENEISLIGNVQDMLIAVCENNESVRSAYIGSENGVSISADADSASKTNTYDPRERGWYVAAKEQNGLIWTDVFEDNSGRGLAITCAKPYYDASGKIAGIAGIGSTLGALSEVVVGTKIGETGYAFIVNENGEIIISDRIQKDTDGKIIRENLLYSDTFPIETAKKIINGESDIEHVTVDGKDCFIAYKPLYTLPWCLAVIITVDEVITPAVDSEKNIFALKNEALGNINMIIMLLAAVFGFLIIIAAAAAFAVAGKLASGLAKPIIELNNGAGIIGSGNLDHKLDVKTGDEIEALSEAFNAMIDNIKRITSEKERIGVELNIATKIQSSMLPHIFPAYPDREEFDIYGYMLPAKEVGGDFYDFFLIDEYKLAMVIADVSGKGVPAALFMVIAKTLIKNNAQYGNSPKDVFNIVNNLLCENNEAGMFVTAFLGVWDMKANTFTYANAGHNPPLIKRSGGNYEWLPTKPGFVLAGMEDMVYKQDEIMLNTGDTIYMYTDGVTEAANILDELFTEPKLLEAANRYKDVNLNEFITRIVSEINFFADGAEQADDMTMLIIKIAGGLA